MQPAATERPMGRRTIDPALSGLGRVRPAGISLSHRALATPVAGRAQCTLTRSPGVRCFLWHIGAAGFLVGWALCQEAVRLGWVVFRRTHGSRPSPLPSPYRSCSDETRLTTTNWIRRNWGEKRHEKYKKKITVPVAAGLFSCCSKQAQIKTLHMYTDPAHRKLCFPHYFSRLLEHNYDIALLLL
jgi:hypothetical protein